MTALSIKEFARLKRPARRVVRLEDFTEEDVALIALSEVPTDQAHLDEELNYLSGLAE